MYLALVVRRVLRHYGFVRLRLNLAVAALVCSAITPAQAAHTQARIVLAAESARPGETIQAGIHLHMDPGWHTYWRNSGQSGLPTTVEWQLPPGVTAGQIQWPLPKKAAEEELTTYVYEDDVVLLVPLKLASDLGPGPLTLKAKLDWLECEKKCIKEGAEVQATLSVGTETKSSNDADLLASWQRRIPVPGDVLSARAWWENAGVGDARAGILEWNSTQPQKEADFFADSSEQFEVEPATAKLSSDTGKVRLRVRVKKSVAAWPKEISGVLIQGSGSERVGYEVRVPFGNSGAAVEAGTIPSAGIMAATVAPPFWKMLLYAFIGGLILNFMPCVLPVIALKILGFVSEAQNEPGRVRKLGLIYTAGVLSSFLVLALIVVGLQAFSSATPIFWSPWLRW
jgi:thiol:disulfide interchange protein DsbD